MTSAVNNVTKSNTETFTTATDSSISSENLSISTKKITTGQRTSTDFPNKNVYTLSPVKNSTTIADNIFNSTSSTFISTASHSGMTSAVNNITKSNTEAFTTSTDSSTSSENLSITTKKVTMGQRTSSDFPNKNIYTLSPVKNSTLTIDDIDRNKNTFISTASISGMISTVDIISRATDITTEPSMTNDVTSTTSGTSTQQSSEMNNFTKTSSQRTSDTFESKSTLSTVTEKQVIVTSVYTSSEAETTTEMSNNTKEETDSAKEDVTKSSAWSTKTAASYIGIGIAGLIVLVSLIAFGWYRKRKGKRRSQQHVDYASSECSNESHNGLV